MAHTEQKTTTDWVAQLRGSGDKGCRTRSPSPGSSSASSELSELAVKNRAGKHLTKLNTLIEFCSKNTDIEPEHVRKMVEQKPNLLSLSIERNVAPVVKWLSAQNMSRASISRTIRKHPNIVASSLERKLQPTLKWLMQGAHVPPDRVAHLIERAPSLLCYSVEGNLSRKLNFLRANLAIDDLSLGRLISDCPHLLISDVEHSLVAHLRWFEVYLDMQRHRFIDIIAKHPKILEYSIDAKIAPVVEFVLSSLQCSRQELASQVQKFPQLFSYSLLRITERVGVVRASMDSLHRGKAVRLGSQGMRKGRPSLEMTERSDSGAYHLPYLLKLTDSAFDRKFRDHPQPPLPSDPAPESEPESESSAPCQWALPGLSLTQLESAGPGPTVTATASSPGRGTGSLPLTHSHGPRLSLSVCPIRSLPVPLSPGPRPGLSPAHHPHDRHGDARPRVHVQVVPGFGSEAVTVVAATGCRLCSGPAGGQRAAASASRGGMLTVSGAVCVPLAMA